MTKDEALRLARACILASLEYKQGKATAVEAVEDIDEMLAQPAQEPEQGPVFNKLLAYVCNVPDDGIYAGELYQERQSLIDEATELLNAKALAQPAQETDHGDELTIAYMSGVQPSLSKPDSDPRAKLAAADGAKEREGRAGRSKAGRNKGGRQRFFFFFRRDGQKAKQQQRSLDSLDSSLDSPALSPFLNLDPSNKHPNSHHPGHRRRRPGRQARLPLPRGPRQVRPLGEADRDEQGGGDAGVRRPDGRPRGLGEARAPLAVRRGRVRARVRLRREAGQREF